MEVTTSGNRTEYPCPAHSSFYYRVPTLNFHLISAPLFRANSSKWLRTHRVHVSEKTTHHDTTEMPIIDSQRPMNKSNLARYALHLYHWRVPFKSRYFDQSYRSPYEISSLSSHITAKFSFIIVIPFHSTTHNCCGCNSVIALSKNDYQNQVLCVTYSGHNGLVSKHRLWPYTSCARCG